uniref:P-type phospholipid transporter n=1 Tax=Eptatretus burgeri TaxID=7764 RepID=A0A8C4N7C9_EPTBU
MAWMRFWRAMRCLFGASQPHCDETEPEQYRMVYPRNGLFIKENARHSQHHKDNVVKTTKYSLLTFLPKNLYEQFHSAEDRFCEHFWKDIKVGDLVLLKQGEVVPADLLLLASSTQHNVCMLNTASLDGENNATLRYAAQASDATECSTFEPKNFSSFVECESPNRDITTFKGILVQKHQQRIGLDHKNLLLRGCTIFNTESVFGLVIYAGHETKALLNVGTTKCKQSRLEKALNLLIIYCILILIAMCLSAAIGHGFWVYCNRGAIFDLPDWHGTWLSAPLAGACTFLIMLMLFQVMIPISLYITIEVMKLGHVYFMQQDIDLYDCQQDVPLQCRSLNIPESLGQVQFLFSDKTGTLTDNCMVFRRCVVAGHEVSHVTAEQGSHGLVVKLQVSCNLVFSSFSSMSFSTNKLSQ